MRLGVSYVVFDGVELLEHSIKHIREHVDWVQVIYQTQSWFGKKAKDEDIAHLKDLFNKGLIDELSHYTSFVPLNDYSRKSISVSKGYEREKRQFGLSSCVRNGCTHYLCMDVDEFYTSSQFKNAKDHVIKNNIKTTSVSFINYVNIPTVHRGYDPNYVPFICEVNKLSKMSRTFYTRCDPTRGISNGYTSNEHETLNRAMITMHHMETVRKNLSLKYESTTRAIFNRNKTNELVNCIKEVDADSNKFDFKKIIFPGINSAKLYKTENIFGIDYLDWNK